MLKRKSALITGATRGIGKAIAIEFAKNNIDVIINYYNDKEEADEVVYWLELLVDSEILPKKKVGLLMKEASELLAIFLASQKTARRKK